MGAPVKRRSKAGASFSGTYRVTRLGRNFVALAMLPFGLAFIAGGLWCGLGPLAAKATVESRSIFLTVCPAMGAGALAFFWHVQVLQLEIFENGFRLRGIRGTREFLNSDIGGYKIIEVGSVTSKEYAHLFDHDGQRVAIVPYWLENWPDVKSWLAVTFAR